MLFVLLMDTFCILRTISRIFGPSGPLRVKTFFFQKRCILLLNHIPMDTNDPYHGGKSALIYVILISSLLTTSENSLNWFDVQGELICAQIRDE